MLEFHPLSLSAKEILTAPLSRNDAKDCDAVFANLYMWSPHYGYQWALAEGCPVIRCLVPDISDASVARSGYFIPGAVPADLSALDGMLSDDASKRGEPLRLYNLSSETAAYIAAEAGDFYAVDSMRSLSDYIYSRESLATLHGRRYQPKRNHINRFVSMFDYSVEPLRAADAVECLSLAERWRAEHHTLHSAWVERQVLERAFAAYDELGLHGVALRVEGRLAAFSFGSYFGRGGHMFCVHAEKADISFEGVYAVVCNELAKSLDPECDIVDREEDMGIAGLRRSKSSWQPLDIVDKYTAVRLDGEQIGIRHLWESVFGDSRRDVDSFLVRYYSPERSVVRYHGDRVTAMAHIVPLTTQAGRTAYIYSVATDPAFRGRGLARSVVDECIARARRAGFDSVALIPAEESLKGFYAAAGFGDTAMPMTFSGDYDFGTGDPARDLAMCLKF